LCEEIQQVDSTLAGKDDFKKLFINNKINKVCDILRKELTNVNEK
jgi:hypothetical protein